MRYIDCDPSTPAFEKGLHNIILPYCSTTALPYHALPMSHATSVIMEMPLCQSLELQDAGFDSL